MGYIRFRLELRAVRDAINELRRAIQEHSKTIHAAEKTQEKSEWSRQPLPVVISYDAQTVRDTQTQQDKQHGTQDSIRKWTRNAVIAASIYAAIAALQWCQMRRANQISRDALVANQRPWIGISEIQVAGPLTYIEGGTKAIFTLRYILKNVGHSSAYVETYGRIINADENWRTAQIDLCDHPYTEARKAGIHWRTSWIAIPEFPMNYFVTFDNQFLDAYGWIAKPMVIDSKTVESGVLQPYIVGCVFYRSVAETDEEIHQARFYAEISRVGPDGKPPQPEDRERFPVKLREGDIQKKELCVVNVLVTERAN